ncbi:hypothetical protein ACIPM2_30265 [Streptomyces sp. NPDC086081]|uniref:hypothetical protein n=1 Tax=Streptomyces sp. NPDC086081 TaxID=3365749 RepID=UPI00380DD388
MLIVPRARLTPVAVRLPSRLWVTAEIRAGIPAAAGPCPTPPGLPADVTGRRDPVLTARTPAVWTRRHPHAVVRGIPRTGHPAGDGAGGELGCPVRDFPLREPLRGQR